MTTSTSNDTINAILDAAEGSPIVELRNRKPELAAQLQTYYDALFAPTEESLNAFGLIDRFLIAARVATHTGSSAAVAWYVDSATRAGADKATIELATDLSNPWTESTPRGAAMRHADLLTTAPANTSAGDLSALKAAGFSPAGIVTLSQIVAFVSYQVRLIAGLRALGEKQ